MNRKLTTLAYYLPQFHAIPENDEWWGKGFTEWTALKSVPNGLSPMKIRRPVEPYFEYELPSSEVMEWQHSVAKEHGIDGFIVWDYWFGEGRRLLEAPARYALENSLTFKYCFMWANHSWYNKTLNKLLMEQKYLGKQDYTRYFMEIYPHLMNPNYVRIDGRPVFGIFLPLEIPDLEIFIHTFETLALAHDLPPFYFIAENIPESHDSARFFDKIVNTSEFFSFANKMKSISGVANLAKELLIRKFNFNFLGPIIYSYKDLVSDHAYPAYSTRLAPTVFTGWDTTPRHRKRGTVLTGFDRTSFTEHIENVFNYIGESKDNLIVVKSWNEWAEGNLLEPDSIYGYDLLKIFQRRVIKYGQE